MKSIRYLIALVFLFVIACNAVQPETVPPDTSDNEPLSVPASLNHHHPLPSPANQPPLRLEPVKVDNPLIAQPAPFRAKLGFRTQAVCNTALQPIVGDTNVKLKLLLVTATSDESGYEAMKTFLERIGVPFDTLVASTTDLCASQLQDASGLGSYQGVILTTNNLAFYDGTNWASAFSATEWQLLSDYERVYKARQVTLYTFPDGSNTGLVYTGYADTTTTPLNVTLTAAGKSVFSSLNPNVSIKIQYAWTYLASAIEGAVPLITTSTGGVIAATRVAPDGRENLAITTAHSTFMMHSLLMNYGIIRWVTRGVFLGDRKHYFSAQVDDYFIPNDVWDMATNTNKFEFKVRATDIVRLKSWQDKLRTTYPSFSSFTTDIAFNGMGYVPSAPRYCSAIIPSNVDGLSAITKCLGSSFRWINHTFTHIYIDNATTETELRTEISGNINVATGSNGLALTAAQFSPAALVTGNHSGLGYLDEATPPNNQGKSRSNVGLVSAAQALGITWLAGNISAPTTTPICTASADDCNQNNPTPNTGVKFPTNLPANNILIQPRFPVNIFYNVTTPAELVDEYNHLYRSYWGRDLTYAEILDFESDQVMAHILSYSVNPHFLHQTNLRFSGSPVSSLYTDFVTRVAQKYAAAVNVPVVNPSMAAIGAVLTARAAYNASGASAVWNRTTGMVTVSATNASASVPLTNPVQGTAYGADKSFTMSAGSSVNVGNGI
jgi:hypothetical protein